MKIPFLDPELCVRHRVGISSSYGQGTATKQTDSVPLYKGACLPDTITHFNVFTPTCRLRNCCWAPRKTLTGGHMTILISSRVSTKFSRLILWPTNTFSSDKFCRPYPLFGCKSTSVGWSARHLCAKSVLAADCFTIQIWNQFLPGLLVQMLNVFFFATDELAFWLCQDICMVDMSG